MMFAAVTAFGAEGFGSAPGEKAAILMVHFGSTFDDTRAVTIDALNADVKAAFPDVTVAEAFTSRIVMKRLAARGIVKLTPREALLRLAADGYTHVFVQSSHIIDGIEMANLRHEAAMMEPFFKEIRVGRPLLYSVGDCLEVSRIMADRYSGPLSDRKGAVVFVGHGSEGPANAIYSQIDYMLSSAGHPGAHVATVEGYPTFDTVLARLKGAKARKVTLVPFMFVAGDHARNDIDGEWRGELVKEGFEVTAVIEGLGQIPAIRNIFVEHIKEGLREKPLNAVELKSNFIRENL